MSKRTPRRHRPKEPTTVALDLTAEQKEKLARDWRCGHCEADPPLVLRTCPTCPPVSLYFRHEPTCPVHLGRVSGAGNIARALAAS